MPPSSSESLQTVSVIPLPAGALTLPLIVHQRTFNFEHSPRLLRHGDATLTVSRAPPSAFDHATTAKDDDLQGIGIDAEELWRLGARKVYALEHSMEGRIMGDEWNVNKKDW